MLATGQAACDCPILFVLDGALTFGTAVERLNLNVAMHALQSAVIVGVSYPGDLLAALAARTFDFTPETPAGKHAELAALIGTEFGGADAFIAFLLEELAPAVRARASEASATRVMLHGFSLGGLLSAHALITRPADFEVFSMISPSLWWNDFDVPARLPELAERIADTGARPRVLVGVGALEQDEPQKAPPQRDLQELRQWVRTSRMVDAAREFAQALSSLPVADVQYACFDGEDHPGAMTAGTGRAMRFALGL